MLNRRSWLRGAACWSALLTLPLVGALPGPCAAARDDGGKTDKRPETTIPLEFCDSLDSRTAKKGDVVALKVVDDVTIDGKLRFRKDADASGIVEGVEKPGRFGKRAQIKLRLDWAKDVNGQEVALASYTTGHRFEPGAAGAGLGGALLLGPIGLLGGALIKGGHLVIKKGTRIQGRVLAESPEKK